MLSLKNSSEELSVYEICDDLADNPEFHAVDDIANQSPQRFIVTTPQSRKITNDPLCLGCEYTELLEDACTLALEGIHAYLRPQVREVFTEKNTTVLHLLRGGLNFGLRNALHRAYGWNLHRSSYLSAQRKRKDSSIEGRVSEEWMITETTYQKPSLAEKTVIVCGDVVATGTSLHYGFRESIQIAKNEGKEILSCIFFTIGGQKAEEILIKLEEEILQTFPSYAGSVVVYLEGRFCVPDVKTPLRIKETGTDLIRRDSLLAPEFIQSQFENPLYPLERCTIYDAGSRSFSFDEYLEDVLAYWEEVKELAESGVTFQELLEERFPELTKMTENSFLETPPLRELSAEHIRNIRTLLKTS